MSLKILLIKVASTIKIKMLLRHPGDHLALLEAVIITTRDLDMTRLKMIDHKLLD